MTVIIIHIHKLGLLSWAALKRVAFTKDLRAVVVVTTEEQCLSPVISNSFVCLTLTISALGITAEDASLKVLAQPLRVRQRQIRKSLFPLNIIPVETRNQTRIISGREERKPLDNVIVIRRRVIRCELLCVRRRLSPHITTTALDSPWGPNVVEPWDHSLDGITNEIHVDWFGKIKSCKIYITDMLHVD